jgi:hypothetical protein
VVQKTAIDITVPRTALCILLLAAARFAAAADPPPFPPGTTQFFRTFAADAVTARDGGVWVALPAGISRYTSAGAGSVFVTPGGSPGRLALSSDGSIWFSTTNVVGRFSTVGALLEQHALFNVSDLAVASDGALWYLRANGSVVGRIASGSPIEFPAPPAAWSLAPTTDGGVWILGSGLGTTNDFLYRMSFSGSVSVVSLGADVLYGRLQTTPEGTLYIGTGYRKALFRLAAGSNNLEAVSAFSDTMFLVDQGQNIWGSTATVLHYLRAGAAPTALALPYDPRIGMCVNIPVWAYRPLAVDSGGGVWLRIFDDGFYLPESPPCPLPNPPEMPTLIRIDASALPAVQAVPASSLLMLMALAACLVAISLWRMRV